MAQDRVITESNPIKGASRAPLTGLDVASKQYREWFHAQNMPIARLVEAFQRGGMKISYLSVYNHLKGSQRPGLKMRRAIEIITNGAVPAWMWDSAKRTRHEHCVQTLAERLRVGRTLGPLAKRNIARRTKRAAARSARTA